MRVINPSTVEMSLIKRVSSIAWPRSLFGGELTTLETFNVGRLVNENFGERVKRGKAHGLPEGYVGTRMLSTLLGCCQRTLNMCCNLYASLRNVPDIHRRLENLPRCKTTILMNEDPVEALTLLETVNERKSLEDRLQKVKQAQKRLETTRYQVRINELLLDATKLPWPRSFITRANVMSLTDAYEVGRLITSTFGKRLRRSGKQPTYVSLRPIAKQLNRSIGTLSRCCRLYERVNEWKLSLADLRDRSVTDVLEAQHRIDLI